MRKKEEKERHEIDQIEKERERELERRAEKREKKKLNREYHKTCKLDKEEKERYGDLG